MQEAPRLRAILLLALALGAATLLALEVQAVGVDLDRPLALAGKDYAGSRACQHCHPSHYASWHGTFHRSMTQEASEATVLGDFAHGRFDYMGTQANMHRDGEGRFVMDFARGAGRGSEHWSAVVTRAVGSRRYQQYLARDGDTYYRLPVAWNIEEGRFMHMNGAFLTPDPIPIDPSGSIDRADYERHVTRWNDNCIYCHNVAPKPGLDLTSGRFDTQVAELGIACEACHGPAAEHVARNHDPLRRFALHLAHRADPTIANPARLSPAKSAQVCGHCHGQRIAPDIEQVHVQGDRFLPGEDLAHYSRPLTRDTTLNGEPDVFAPRFWPDGTSRLTAYEYQGLLQSECAKHGNLTCTSCHGMHDGNPRGQMRPNRLDDNACTSCHTKLTSDLAKANHSHHSAGSSGARCLECHMPKVVYGLVSAHRSHRIDLPRPDLGSENSRPDACTLCHTDKSRDWAAAALAHWQDKRPDPEQSSPLPEAPRLLFAGDPIERAIAADALGRTDAATNATSMRARLGFLLDVLQDDSYPAVRSIAWHALRNLLALQYPNAVPAVSAFTATDTASDRRRELSLIARSLPEGAVEGPSDALVALRAHARDSQIFIGE